MGKDSIALQFLFHDTRCQCLRSKEYGCRFCLQRTFEVHACILIGVGRMNGDCASHPAWIDEVH